MEENMIEKIRAVNENPDMWLFEANAVSEKGYILSYDFEKKRTYVHVDLPEKIRERMKQLNISQAQLGDLVGISQGEVSRFFNRHTIPIRYLERILALLEML